MNDITDRVRRLAAEGGWIGVDFDGTMFTYDKWVGWNVFGKPIKPMIDRIHDWLNAGIEVRVVTARIGLPDSFDHLDQPVYSARRMTKCRVTGIYFSDRMMELEIQKHCLINGLSRLRVQCYKDVNMITLYDDRAVQVIPNTGQTLAEAHAAELSAFSNFLTET